MRRLIDDGLTCSFIDPALYRPSRLWIDFNERTDFLPDEGPWWCKLFVLMRGLGPSIKDFFHSRFAPRKTFTDADLVIFGLVISSELPMDSMLEMDFLEPSAANRLAAHALGARFPKPFAASGSGGRGQSGADSGD